MLEVLCQGGTPAVLTRVAPLPPSMSMCSEVTLYIISTHYIYIKHYHVTITVRLHVIHVDIRPHQNHSRSDYCLEKGWDVAIYISISCDVLFLIRGLYTFYYIIWNLEVSRRLLGFIYIRGIPNCQSLTKGKRGTKIVYHLKRNKDWLHNKYTAPNISCW